MKRAIPIAVILMGLMLGVAGPVMAQKLKIVQMIDDLANWKRAGQAAMPFLRLGAGARSMGMADAALGLRGDPATLFYNPAGLAYVNGRSVMVSNMDWLIDTQIMAAAAAVNLGSLGVLGASFMYYDYGDPIPATEIDAGKLGGYGDIGTIEPSQYMVGLAYARQISDRFAIGGQVKIAHEDLLGGTGVKTRIAYQLPGGGWKQDAHDAKRTVFALDFGTSYDTGFRGLILAFAFRNFGQEVKYERESYDLPLSIQFGVSAELFRLLNMEMNGQKVLITGDYLHPRDWSERAQVGMEYAFRDLFFVRAGYKFNYSSEGLCAGMGVKVPLGFGDARIDYAYKHTSDTLFDAVHVYSLNISF